MRYLIIGGDGFVGRALCSFLTNLGHSTISFDIKQGEAFDARSATLPLQNIDGVFFLAWDVGGSKYLYEASTQYQQLLWNLPLMENVFRQLKETRLPFMYVSSQLADSCDTVYGVTKRLGEVWGGLLGGARVRLWNVYGNYEDNTQKSHVLSDFVHKALGTGTIDMLTTGEEIRQFIYVDDVCKAFLHALNTKPSGVFDVTSCEWVSVREVAEVIAKITGAKVQPGQKIGSSPRTPNIGLLPGWRPEISLHEGIKRMVELYKQERRKAA